MPIFLADDLAREAPMREPCYIGESLLPQTGCLLITGRTETGKSVVGMEMAISLALGENLWGAVYRKSKNPIFPIKHACRVLYLDSELGPSGSHQRLEAFYRTKLHGVTLGENFKVVTGVFDPLLLHTSAGSREGYDNLEKLIVATAPQVVVVDPLGDFHNYDENSSEMRLVFHHLRALQLKHHFASILIHHETDKDMFAEGGHIVRREGTGRSRGHSSITQAVDTMLCVRREKKNPYTFLELEWAKCRHQTRPPRSWVFVDFKRMAMRWIGTARGMNPVVRRDFLAQYEQLHPLEPEELDEDL